ncbi:hypothetical protein TRVL_02975 [Trypanosoma vivax]|nr:hypothetical protein TRVL_02975 [Trypanosoma vivax]
MPSFLHPLPSDVLLLQTLKSASTTACLPTAYTRLSHKWLGGRASPPPPLARLGVALWATVVVVVVKMDLASRQTRFPFPAYTIHLRTFAPCHPPPAPLTVTSVHNVHFFISASLANLAALVAGATRSISSSEDNMNDKMGSFHYLSIQFSFYFAL